MRPTAPYPTYYVPEGVPKPAHIPWLAPAQLLPDGSPDGTDGFYWGGAPYDPMCKGDWRKTADGWWLNIVGRDPGHLARITVIDGPIVFGVNEMHAWMVPQLLRWHPEAALVSAIPEVLRMSDTGGYGWAPPARLAPLMERLRALMLFGANETVPLVSDDDARDLAVAILALNYHVSIHELAIAEWLNTKLVRDVIEAAGGVVELRNATEARKVASAG